MRIKHLLFLALCLTAGVVSAGPDIQHWTTANGARVYFVPATELNIVDVQVVFDAGSARDGGAPGLALLTNALLPEGAADLDSDRISERFESLGARLGNSAQMDTGALTLRSLSDAKYLDPALDTLATLISQPSFPPDAFERERSRLLIGIQSRKQSPDEIADEAFYAAVFKGHPYATPTEGTEASVKALLRDDLVRFHKQYYVARNAVLAIVGNVTRAQAEQVAEKLVGKLPAGEVAAPLPPVPALTAAAEVRIEHPSAQTHILVGQPGMRRDDADYFALYVGNHMLGGNGLVSRLSDEIREKRGLAYSTYSYFMPMRQSGPYVIGAQTRNDSAAESLRLMKEAVTHFVQDGPTAKELTASKKNITGGFALRISSNKKIVDYIAMIGFYNLPLDYLNTFNAKVEAVTADSIKEAFKRRINPAAMVTVLVGAGNGK